MFQEGALIRKFKQRRRWNVIHVLQVNFPASQWWSHFLCFIELISEETEEDKEHTCETLLMCIVTVLSHGLRSGGGVGDVLRKPSKEVNHHHIGERKRGTERGHWRSETFLPQGKGSYCITEKKVRKCPMQRSLRVFFLHSRRLKKCK